jgi:thiol peroxidase
MNQVNFKGNKVALKGDVPAVGAVAEDFKFVKSDLTESSLYQTSAKAKVIISVPSLDTGVCALETKTFNKQLSDLSDVQGIVISEDLPFAMKRFCELEGITNVVAGSDFRYQEFKNKYNTEIKEGPLSGLSTRAVWVLNGENKVTYMELVPEITSEPNYNAAIDAVKKLVNE